MARRCWTFALPALALALTFLITGNDAVSSLQTVRERGLMGPAYKFGEGQNVKPKYWTSTAAAAAGRLPTSIVPLHYDLTLTPVLDKEDPILGEAFGIALGSIMIRVECKEAVNSVTLHVSRAYVTISEESVQVVHAITDEDIPVDSIEYDDEFDLFTIYLSTDLVADNEYQLIVSDFNTTIAEDRYDGLYLTQYQTPGEAEPSLIAVTTFAASAARQAFPCFDEPALKATFQITIGRAADFISLSNTERISEDPDRLTGWIFDTYARTVKMSTYLAIVFVAQYDYKEAGSTLPGDKPVRIYAPPYMVARNGADYAADLAQKVMTYFENYFEIDYKLNKYDSAAIPDFQFGAMENYGLVTYMTPFLMYFDGETTETQRKRISSIVAHESSHQWFGNLMTAKWWNHIWLNEGFASYLAPLGVAHTDPEFEPAKGFLNDVFQYSMPFDSDPSYAHPILSSDLITAPYYDRMNYEKAACLIRMMEAFLTPTTLKESLKTFLTEFSFMEAGQDDLFLILTNQAHNDGTLNPDMSVKDVMDTWTQQAGFPLVRVYAFGTSAVLISQERFVPLPVNALDQRDLDPNELWTIPVTIATASNPDFTKYTPDLWFRKDQQIITHEHNANEWILLNVDATAYYRVLYDAALLSRIISQLNTNLSVISPLSRSQLIDDYFKSAMQLHVGIESALDLTTYLGAERDPHVWDTVLTNFEPISTMLMGNAGFGALREHLVPKLEATITELGIDQLPGDKGNKVLHRLQLLDWACALDSSLCINRAKELFAAWQAAPENPATFVPLDLQPVIFCAAVASDLEGASGVMNFVQQRYEQEITPEGQKAYLLNALACSVDMPRVDELLREIVSPAVGTFLDPDARALLQRIVSNPQLRLHALNFIRGREELDGLINRFGLSIVSETVATIATFANTAQELADIENFINENAESFQPIKPALDRALVKIEDSISWMTRFGTRIIVWLQLQAQNANDQLV